MQRLSWKGQTTCLGVCATRVRWCTVQLTGDSRNEDRSGYKYVFVIATNAGGMRRYLCACTAYGAALATTRTSRSNTRCEYNSRCVVRSEFDDS